MTPWADRVVRMALRLVMNTVAVTIALLFFSEAFDATAVASVAMIVPLFVAIEVVVAASANTIKSDRGGRASLFPICAIALTGAFIMSNASTPAPSPDLVAALEARGLVKTLAAITGGS
jgi:hypothetical protein